MAYSKESLDAAMQEFFDEKVFIGMLACKISRPTILKMAIENAFMTTVGLSDATDSKVEAMKTLYEANRDLREGQFNFTETT